jgi:ABC-2 type transport system permease protein
MSNYWRLVSVTLRAQMANRASFFFESLTTALINTVYFATLAAVFARFGALGGWSLAEVGFLFGLLEISFALMDMVFSGFDPGIFSQHVRRGTLDQFLLRPVSLPVQIFASEFALRRLGRIAQGAVILGWSLSLLAVPWPPLKVAYLLVVILSTVAFFGGLFVAGAAICFWTVQSIEAVNLFTYGGSEMLSYPLHIYGDWLRRFFTFVIPGALVTYYPALYFLGKLDPFGLPTFMQFLAPLAGGAVLAAGFAFWRLGLRRYTSTGT